MAASSRPGHAAGRDGSTAATPFPVPGTTPDRPDPTRPAARSSPRPPTRAAGGSRGGAAGTGRSERPAAEAARRVAGASGWQRAVGRYFFGFLLMVLGPQQRRPQQRLLGREVLADRASVGPDPAGVTAFPHTPQRAAARPAGNLRPRTGARQPQTTAEARIASPSQLSGGCPRRPRPTPPPATCADYRTDRSRADATGLTYSAPRGRPVYWSPSFGWSSARHTPSTTTLLPMQDTSPGRLRRAPRVVLRSRSSPRPPRVWEAPRHGVARAAALRATAQPFFAQTPTGCPSHTAVAGGSIWHPGPAEPWCPGRPGRGTTRCAAATRRCCRSREWFDRGSGSRRRPALRPRDRSNGSRWTAC